MTPEAQMINSEKEMLIGTSEEKIIFRLRCIHHKVCKYMCFQVCPYRDTTKSEAALELCEFLDCNNLAMYEGWYDRKDFSGNFTGLSVKTKVCEFHKKELRQQQER